MSSSRKVFFYLVLIVAMIFVGVVLQFLLAQSKKQAAVNAEQIYALQQVHSNTQAISNELYRGEPEAPQQLQTHQKVMEKQLRQFNQQSNLLNSQEARKAAADESVELNHAWFAVSQLLSTLENMSAQLVAQRETKNQLFVLSSEMLTKIDDLTLALGRESRLKNSVSSALSYVDLMAEVSNIRLSSVELQMMVKKIGELETEPSSLSANIIETLQQIENSINTLVQNTDRVVKIRLVELLETRDSFVIENEKWSENLPVLSDAFLNSNSIKQRSEDFSLQLNTKLRSGSESQRTKQLRWLAYLLPILGALLLLIGGRRYIQSTSTHLAIAQGSVDENIESVKQAEELKTQLVSVEEQKEQLEADLEAQGQKMQAVASDAAQYLSDLEEFTAKLDVVETDAEDIKQKNKKLITKLQESEEIKEKHRLDAVSQYEELQSMKLSIDSLERENHEIAKQLQESEYAIEQYQVNDNNALNGLELAQKELADMTEKSVGLTESLDSVESQVIELQALNEKLTQDVQVAEEYVEKHQEKYQEKVSIHTQELDALNIELEQLNANSSETQALLEAKSSDYDSLKKEKQQLDFEFEAQQQEFDHLLSQLTNVEDDLSQRLEVDNETTQLIAAKVNNILDGYSASWNELSLLAGRMNTVSSDVHDFYSSNAVNIANEDDVKENVRHIEGLQATSERLAEALNKLLLGGKASADIVAETSAMAVQGVGSMKVINRSLESSASTINNMLPPLERLTENSQLMKSVVELLDSISKQAQSLDESDMRGSLGVTANDHDGIDSKYDLFENFHMATTKMTELISEVLSDVEGLASAIQASMNDVQDSSVHAIAMAKLMKQVNVSQSQLSRLIRALLTQTDLQTAVVRDFSDQLSEISANDQDSFNDVDGVNGNENRELAEETVEQLVELSRQLKTIAEQRQ